MLIADSGEGGSDDDDDDDDGGGWGIGGWVWEDKEGRVADETLE